MALDMHSKATIQEILQVEINNGYVFFQVSYKVKRGRKIYKIWLLADDFKETGLFPICFRRMNQGRYGDVLDMHNNVIYTGSLLTCREIVVSANKRFMEAYK
jgi:hypothetical protein